ncbi:MAG: SGNH/GDSL hydrolase family protein [Clostridia bacterium]|nr:SGNH/GDSL hydrolase family protein [Clostridia bacterium]
MNLSFEQIKAVTCGAARVTYENGYYRFYRFTSEQEELYRTRRDDFYQKTFAASGIKLRFFTDSQTLTLNTSIESGSSRRYFCFDVFVNRKPVGYLKNFEDEKLPLNYSTERLEQGEFSKQFCLGNGKKEVCVYLPWSANTKISAISIDNGAYITPIKEKKRLLAFGDSITHGYDALHPSNKYITKLADFLGADEYNKAIGGEMFFPALADTRESFIPDYITVAYGTNDWNYTDREAFESNCKSFLLKLSNSYPDTLITVITPIWRKDKDECRKFGEFCGVEEYLKNVVCDIKNARTVSGYAFLPQSEEYFGDLRLHPNDKGFECYFKNLSKHF